VRPLRTNDKKRVEKEHKGDVSFMADLMKLGHAVESICQFQFGIPDQYRRLGRIN